MPRSLPPEALLIAAKAFKTSSGFCILHVLDLDVDLHCAQKLTKQPKDKKMKYTKCAHVRNSGGLHCLISIVVSTSEASIYFPRHLRLAGLLVLRAVRGPAKDLYRPFWALMLKVILPREQR